MGGKADRGFRMKGRDMIQREWNGLPDHKAVPVIGPCECGYSHDGFFDGDMAKVNGQVYVYRHGWMNAQEANAAKVVVEMPK
jgi:hypothetical protein